MPLCCLSLVSPSDTLVYYLQIIVVTVALIFGCPHVTHYQSRPTEIPLRGTRRTPQGGEFEMETSCGTKSKGQVSILHPAACSSAGDFRKRLVGAEKVWQAFLKLCKRVT